MKDKHEQRAGDRAFMLRNGDRIDSIKELYEKLESMDDDVFSHHVNSERNDFSNWLKDVFSAHSLAENVSLLSDRSEFKSAVGEHIAKSQRKASLIPKINTRALMEMLKPKRQEKQQQAHKESIIKKNWSLFTQRISPAIAKVKSLFRFKRGKNKSIDLQPVIDKMNGKNSISLTVFATIMDFALGFTVGALSIILMIRII
jgi:hypothetical protein